LDVFLLLSSRYPVTVCIGYGFKGGIFMSRKGIVDGYSSTDHKGRVIDCEIKSGKSKEKTKLGFYLNQLRGLEEHLSLSRAQMIGLSTKAEVYYPVCVMLTFNFKSEKVQIDKFLKELRAILAADLALRKPNKEFVFNHYGVREIHDHTDLTKPKPKVHHHLVLSYCKNSFTTLGLKRILNGRISSELEALFTKPLPSLKRYYAIGYESGKPRLPFLSKTKRYILNEDGSNKMVTKLVTSKDSFKKETTRVYQTQAYKKNVALYTLKENMISCIQHFSYITKVATKEVPDSSGRLIEIPEIGRITPITNTPMLRKVVKALPIEYPKVHTKQPRVNAKVEQAERGKIELEEVSLF